MEKIFSAKSLYLPREVSVLDLDNENLNKEEKEIINATNLYKRRREEDNPLKEINNLPYNKELIFE